MLALPFIISTLTSLPCLFLLYSVKKPSYMLIANIVMFVIITVGCYLFIPVYGVVAPPYVIAVSFTVGLIIFTLAAFYQYKKLRLISTPGVEKIDAKS